MTDKKEWTVSTKIAFITLIILILCTIAGVIATTAKDQQQIDQNRIDIQENKVHAEDCEKESKRHAERITTIETHYEHIKETLDRIETKVEGALS